MTYDEYIINSKELYHHGVLGMKWGVRRYQNKDGSLTPAGRDRYSDEISSAKQKIKDISSADYSFDQEDTRRRRIQFAKRDLSDLKIKQKLFNEGSKSNSRLEAEKKLIEKEGYSPEQAAIEAYRRDRLKKIALATAGVTVTAAAAYVAYKHWDNVVDKVIDPGTLLSRVTTDNTKRLGERFYSAVNETKDAYKYAGTYAKELHARTLRPTYQKTIKAIETIKLASRKTASNALRDLVENDSDYRSELIKSMEEFRTEIMLGGNVFSPSIRVMGTAIDKLKSGKYDDSVYDGFNIALASISSSVNSKFYSKLVSSGYDAIVDMNDKKYSGYGTKMPMIIFNTSKTVVDGIKELGINEIAKNIEKSATPVRDIMAISKITGIPALAMVLSEKITKSATDAFSDNQLVKKYKKDHPNSKLSDRDIVRNYYGYK